MFIVRLKAGAKTLANEPIGEIVLEARAFEQLVAKIEGKDWPFF